MYIFRSVARYTKVAAASNRLACHDGYRAEVRIWTVAVVVSRYEVTG
jgi:hypothetical protein